ncbi:MAG: FKBP-type peptidyl-prolyl cis-trans isomerase, partial [Nanoarchaeota archaeon]|nr:FKBP-type peptidyl-prolyl cis-trans isomerase [Nanoarchaeota archaeon]
TGTLKDDNIVFDTTDAKVAEENGIFDEKTAYGPVIVCIGEGQLIPGLDKKIEGKEAGKEYDINLTAEESFGKKDAKLIQLIPTSRFKKDKVQPMPGMQVNIDGITATIKSVSGGRTLVDFNHPLSGKDLAYKINIKRIVEHPKEKIQAYLKLQIGLKDIKVEMKDNVAEIELPIPKEAQEELAKKLKEITGVDARFATPKEEKK